MVIAGLGGQLGIESLDTPGQAVVSVTGVPAPKLVELGIGFVQPLVLFLPVETPAQPGREPTERDGTRPGLLAGEIDGECDGAEGDKN